MLSRSQSAQMISRGHALQIPAKGSIVGRLCCCLSLPRAHGLLIEPTPRFSAHGMVHSLQRCCCIEPQTQLLERIMPDLLGGYLSYRCSHVQALSMCLMPPGRAGRHWLRIEWRMHVYVLARSCRCRMNHGLSRSGPLQPLY